MENIELLNNKFNSIKNMGWIQSIKKGSSGIGLTFEHLIGINENEFEIPDFNGIELKTKRSKSTSYTTLFNATPDGPHFHEVERLRTIYGYPHSKAKEYKVLNVSTFANQLNNMGIKYYSKLKLDYNNQKLTLSIYNKNKDLIENEVFWYFDTLKEKLLRKLKVLAYINADTKRINNIEYFKYYKMTIYLLKDFDTFLSLIEQGIIRVTFKINVNLSGPRKGQICDHGTGFDIQENDLLKLYNYYLENE